MTPTRQYPYQDGDTTVLGPEIFASADGQVISWRGENYVRQHIPDQAFALPMVTGPALLYVSSVDNRGTQAVQRADQEALDYPRERSLCRALLRHALDLLDATEPARRAPVGQAEARRS
jgi:hypothetical protein